MTSKSVVAGVLALAFIMAMPGMVRAHGNDDEKKLGMGSSTTLDSTTLACLASAVASRETTVGSAWTTYANAVGAAYTARASALSSVYSGTKTRAQIKTEVKAAWKAFKDSVKSARKALNDSRKSAWSTFKTSAKACKAPADTTEAGNSGQEA